MKVLDLFSGIGGFALAFEAAGFETIAFAEIEPYPCKVLAQHWPAVPNLGDVRTIDGRDFAGVDVVCGGFPCQDISAAGKGAGIHGERSGLWFEMLRIIRGARPAFCLLENSPWLRARGIDDVLSGLEQSGYSARPFVVGAWSAGRAHKRDRVWVVAYSQSARLAQPKIEEVRARLSGPEYAGLLGGRVAGNWPTPPGVRRMADGIPDRAHRIKALGNSIVPAVAYPFARWIYEVLKANEVSAAQPQKEKEAA